MPEIPAVHDGVCSTSWPRHHRNCPGCLWLKREYDRQRVEAMGDKRREQIRKYDTARYSTPQGMSSAREKARATNARYSSRTHEQADLDFARLRGDGKHCAACRELLSMQHFFRMTSGPDGRSRRCKPCYTAHYAARRWAALTAHWKGRGIPGDLCFYCERPIRKGFRAIDHFIPIARGGIDHWSNLVPSCPLCNGSKGKKEPLSWVAEKWPNRLEWIGEVMCR